MGAPSTLPGTANTSSLSVSDTITRVRALLNETTAAFFTDAQIEIWINEAIIDVIAKTWCLGVTETVTLVADTLEYSLTEDHMGIVSVLYNDTKALLKGHPSKVGHVADVDEPVYYYEFNGKIGIYPLSSVTNDIEVYLVKYPAYVSGADTLPTPVLYDDPIVSYATMKGLLRDNEPAVAMQMKKDYEENLTRYRVDYGNTLVDKLSDIKQET